MSATLITIWHCLTCEERHEGDAKRMIRDAERHLKHTRHHGYTTHVERRAA